jgi:murein L,D-transpeptidase YafK
MIYEIKRLFLFKIKNTQYRLHTYRQNIAIRKAFQSEVRQAYYPLISTPSILFISLLFVSTIIVYNIKGNTAKTVEANLTIPPVINMPNIQRPPAPPVISEDIKETEEQLDRKDDFVIAVDKTKKELLVLSRIDKDYRIVDRFNILLGKNSGDKVTAGDMKTPEGAYKIIAAKNDDELIPMYGPMAFVLNYPNDIDKKQGKTGSGIWIHGVENENREPSTKGCIVMNNRDLVKLNNYIKINTSIFIFPEKFVIPVNDNKVSDVLNESFIMELKNSVIAANTSTAKQRL